MRATSRVPRIARLLGYAKNLDYATLDALLEHRPKKKSERDGDACTSTAALCPLSVESQEANSAILLDQVIHYCCQNVVYKETLRQSWRHTWNGRMNAHKTRVDGNARGEWRMDGVHHFTGTPPTRMCKVTSCDVTLFCLWTHFVRLSRNQFGKG